jgi:hypothetical protein
MGTNSARGTNREWRRMERRAVKGHERDLLAALEKLSSGRPEVTGIDVDPGTGLTVTMGLGRQQLVMGPLSPSSAAVVSRVRRDAEVVGFDAVGRYGPFWWIRLSTGCRPVTLLGRRLRLSSGGGGTRPTPEPDRPERGRDRPLVGAGGGPLVGTGGGQARR